MSDAPKGRIGSTLLLLVMVAALVAGALLYRSQAAEIRQVRDEVAGLRLEAKELGIRADGLVGDLATLRIERNKLRDALARLEERSNEIKEALATALADLELARRERDEHLAKRLDLARRLEDALTEIAKRNRGGR